ANTRNNAAPAAANLTVRIGPPLPLKRGHASWPLILLSWLPSLDLPAGHGKSITVCDTAAPTGSHSARRATRDTPPRSTGRREPPMDRVGQGGGQTALQSTGHRRPPGRHRQAGWCGMRSFRGSAQACYEGRLSLVTPADKAPATHACTIRNADSPDLRLLRSV